MTDKTVTQEFRELREAFVNLFLTISHELKLDAFVEWLADRLKAEEEA